MSALFVERGYGQVEANRLSGITFGNIEAQAPAYMKDAAGAFKPIPELENGMFLCVIADTSEALAGAGLGRIAVLPGDVPADQEETCTPYLVYSERKQYDEREMYCDFVDKAADKVDGLLFPKLIGMTPDSDVYTTNTLNNAKHTASVPTVAVGDVFYVGDDGYLTKTAAKNKVYCFEVSKVYTMPDNQTGIKLQCKRYHA